MKGGLFALRENPEAHEITQEQFLRAVKETIPSVTPEMEDDSDRLGRRLKQEPMRIGFRPPGRRLEAG